jgi:pilus assembly protein CpaE
MLLVKGSEAMNPAGSQKQEAPAAPAVSDVTIPKISAAAFCEDANLHAAVSAAAADRRMARAELKLHKGGAQAATALFKGMPSPNLVILESTADIGDLLEDLETLSRECVAGTKVIVIGHDNDVSIYRELLEKGVSDYLVAPLDPAALILAISRCFRDVQQQKLGRITAFIGARGGSGSSTVAHNVAVASATRRGSEILLADLDLHFGTTGLDFDIDHSNGIAEILRQSDRVDEVLLERLATRHSERLLVLPSVPVLGKGVSVKAPEFQRLLAIAHSSSRHLMLDMPGGWSPLLRETLVNVDEIVITAVPDLASMRNAKNLIAFLKEARPNDPPPKLVLNQVGMPKRPEMKPSQFAAGAGMEPAVCIPFDAALFGKAANDGKIVVEMAPRSKPTQAFYELSRSLSGQRESRRRGSGGLKGLLMRKLKGRRWSDQ